MNALNGSRILKNTTNRSNKIRNYVHIYDPFMVRSEQTQEIVGVIVMGRNTPAGREIPESSFKLSPLGITKKIS